MLHSNSIAVKRSANARIGKANVIAVKRSANARIGKANVIAVKQIITAICCKTIVLQSF
ncbi:MAG: hypothetical protein WC356_05375 [Candidatus Micrarchaeia archaeon]